MDKWEMVRLGDVANINMGQSPASETYNDMGKGLPFFQGKTDFQSMYPTIRMFCSAPQKTANKNDILMSVRAPVGAVNIATQNCCIGRGLAAISETENVSYYRYLFYYLRYKENDIANMGVGSTFKAISRKDISMFSIPLPPLKDQRKIADVLDKASALIELRKTQLEKLDLLIKSQFIEMFGDPVTNPKGWEISNINSICNVIVDCPHSTPYYLQEDTGYMCIRTSVLKNNRIDWNRVEYISSEQFVERTKRYVPKENDIVYSREGAILGIAAVIDRNVNIALGQRMMLFSINVQKCHCYYLWFVLNQNAVTRQVQDKIGGSASPHINVKDIKTFEIPVPPIKLQNEFAAFVECVENQKKILQQSLEKLELNYKSLMQKCFRGDLF